MPAVVYEYGAEVKQLKDALGEVEQGLVQTDKQATKTGDSIDKGAKKGSKGMADAAKTAGKLAAGLLAAGAAAAKLVQEAADLVNELTDLSAKTGVATSTLNGLQLAFEGSGQDASAMERVLKTLPQRMLDAKEGTGKAKRAFDELGVSVEDAQGNLRSSDEVLKELIAKLQATEDPTMRAALATDAFGTSGAKLMQAVGGTELEAFTEMANRFGTDVGPEASQAAADWQREMANLKNLFRGTLTSVLEFVGGGLDSIRNFQLGFVAAITAVREIVADWAERTMHAFSAVKAAMSGDFAQAVTQMKHAWGGLGDSARRIADATMEAAAAYHAASTAIRDAGTAAKETGEEIEEGGKKAEENGKKAKQSADEAKEAADQAADAWTEWKQATTDAYDAALKKSEDLRKAEEQRVAEAKQAAMEQREALMASSVEATAEGIQGLLKGTTEESQKTAVKLFRLQQAAALTSIAISTAQAVMKVTAQTGVGAAIAVPAVIAAGSVQAASVLAQSPPTFDVGGIIDAARAEANQLISAQAGESVLTRAATARLGRRGGEALNSGQGMAKEITVVNQYQHRTFDAMVRDNLRRPGPLSKAIRGDRKVGQRRSANG